MWILSGQDVVLEVAGEAHDVVERQRPGDDHAHVSTVLLLPHLRAIAAQTTQKSPDAHGASRGKQKEVPYSHLSARCAMRTPAVGIGTAARRDFACRLPGVTGPIPQPLPIRVVAWIVGAQCSIAPGSGANWGWAEGGRRIFGEVSRPHALAAGRVCARDGGGGVAVDDEFGAGRGGWHGGDSGPCGGCRRGGRGGRGGAAGRALVLGAGPCPPRRATCSAQLSGQCAAQRSLQMVVRKASSGLRCWGAQCCPARLKRGETTTLCPLSTQPLPRGSPRGGRSCSRVGRRASRNRRPPAPDTRWG